MHEIDHHNQSLIHHKINREIIFFIHRCSLSYIKRFAFQMANVKHRTLFTDHGRTSSNFSEKGKTKFAYSENNVVFEMHWQCISKVQFYLLK